MFTTFNFAATGHWRIIYCNKCEKDVSENESACWNKILDSIECFYFFEYKVRFLSYQKTTMRADLSISLFVFQSISFQLLVAIKKDLAVVNNWIKPGFS